MLRPQLAPLLLLAGCYGGASLDVGTPGSTAEEPVDAPQLPPGASAPPTPGMPPSPLGDGTLPCEIAALLAAECQSCHSSPPKGAPMPLVTHAELTAPAASDPSRTVAQRSLERMKSATSPMPPSGASLADIATLEAWVAAGAPKGSCGSTPDAGPSTPPGPQPTVCSSGDFWNGGNDGSPLMHPGMACITCHRGQAGDDAPRLTIAGTVYPTLHEKNDCYGDKDVVVEVTDAAGKVVSLTSNNYGNFLSTTALAMPIRARVLFQGRVREMVGAQPSADCNSCHTEQGASGAPGRILRP